jgi:Skp family chaperone for outer membrane proteins
MKTRNFAILALALIGLTTTIQAQRGVRIGYIDMEYILENVPEYRESQIQLEGKVQRWKNDIDKMQKEIDQMKLNLSNERVLLTKELIEEREEEIKILEDEMLEYQQSRFGPNGDLIIQRRQLVQPIQDQVFNLVQEIAENKKFDFIFDKSADVVMLFAAERHDISDQVVRSITRAAKREEAQSRKERIEVEKEEELSGEQQDAKSEREQMLEERRRQRDSIRDAKRAEFERRRDSIIQLRNARRDSIMNARNQAQNPPGEGGGEGNGEGGN